ncbi:MAG TPA: hypothetical protein VK575_01940, partial [Gemmatimonadaceae bacterium]|nr:hypothetical protein [Gemmatimonadaceae bacterium]
GTLGITRWAKRRGTGVTEAVASGAKLGSLPLAEIIRVGWRRLMDTRALTVTGFVGIALGLICLAVMAARGGVPIPPEGDLSKPATFNIAVGIYILTITLLLPSAGFSERGRKRWVWWNVGLFAYAYIIETGQVFRGLDPRFSRHGTPLDQIAGGVFFLTALGVMVLFIIMAVKFFRRGRPDADSPIILAIRYGSAAALGAFTAGIWMSVIQGRTTGAAGNILPLHALGFHGLQAVPLIALLLLWSGYDSGETRKWVHATGIVWVAACAAVAWQTIAGRSVSEMSAATLATGFLLAVWAGVGLFAFWRWASTPATPLESPDT